MTGLTADVTVHRGDFTLQVRLSAEPRRITAVLGPNGAGKSSLMQALAGLLAVDDGRITIGDVTVDDAQQRLFVPPERRRVGVVFQDLLLFPHLSVLQNVAFGPRSRGVDDPDTAARAALARLGIADLADRRPEGLSGGQAQRVAMARALATDPDLLLLDEPLAALDAATRIQVRRELRTFLSDFAGTTLLVTHDPLDALVLADDVIVIEGGRITQQGSIADVVRHPRTEYVATLVGVNLVHATARDGVATDADGTTIAIADHALTGDVVVIIRPEAVSLHRARPEGSPRNVWPVTVTSLEARLDRTLVHVSGPPDLAVALTPAAVADLGLQPGDQVWASAKALDLDAHPRSAA